MTLAALLQQQQITANPVRAASRAPSNGAVPLHDTLPPPIGSNRTVSARLRKRHSTWDAAYTREIMSQELDWVNPCGGRYDETVDVARLQPRKPTKVVLLQLQHLMGREHRHIKVSTPDINISDMRTWKIHKKDYSFLPVLKLDSNIALRRWHRQMQIFVASFGHLRRAQIKWDHFKSGIESVTSKEIQMLRMSAQRIMCQLEVATNNTAVKLSSNGKRVPRLAFMTRVAMQRKLQFRTNLTRTDGVYAANPIDLKYAKYRYFGYIRAMLKILRGHTTVNRNVSSSSATMSRDINKQEVSVGTAPNQEGPAQSEHAKRVNNKKKNNMNRSSINNNSNKNRNSSIRNNIKRKPKTT